MPVINGAGLIEERAAAIRALHKAAGCPRAELDLSGGADSGAMLGLLVVALGPENITLVHTRINTAPDQTERAVKLAKALGVPLINPDMTDIYELLVNRMVKACEDAQPAGPWYGGPGLMGPGERVRREIYARIENDPTILGSLRSCLRAPFGRGFNRLMGGGIRHGTGNECEDRFLRYYQKGGDGEVDTNPIEMMSKTEVWQLLWHLGEHFGGDARTAFRAMIAATPTADLWGKPGAQTDCGEIKNWLGVPFHYGAVDPDTGRITEFGTIERMSRTLDLVYDSTSGSRCMTVGDFLFNAENPTIRYGALAVDQLLVPLARRSFPADTFTDDEVKMFLLAAHKAERATRHKANGNIPMLGDRASLVAAGILSNNLD